MSEENAKPTFCLDDFGTTGASSVFQPKEDELEVRLFPGKPFTTNDDPMLMFNTHVYIDKNNVSYMVSNDVAHQLGNDVRKRTLVLACEGVDEFFLLSVGTVNQKNRLNSWIRSGQDALLKSSKKYVRVIRDVDSYRATETKRPMPKVKWPEITLEEIINKAFGDRFITDTEHPIVVELLGL
jgi:hypothetical protein